jgi:alpha-tubulin suppressor-like RCC1 family protein
VLVWGAGEDGQLGQGDLLSYVSTPTFCDALRGQRICQVACGAGLTAAISVDGRVWAWGKLLERYSMPTLFMDADDRVNQIACGANNMAAWQGTLLPHARHCHHSPFTNHCFIKTHTHTHHRTRMRRSAVAVSRVGA